jgi:hypothetical protein
VRVGTEFSETFDGDRSVGQMDIMAAELEGQIEFIGHGFQIAASISESVNHCKQAG